MLAKHAVAISAAIEGSATPSYPLAADETQLIQAGADRRSRIESRVCNSAIQFQLVDQAAIGRQAPLAAARVVNCLIQFPELRGVPSTLRTCLNWTDQLSHALTIGGGENGGSGVKRAGHFLDLILSVAERAGNVDQ